MMENDLRYRVGSREIVDLVSAMRSERLTLEAYFQRNLVWRDAHKRDFIDTILKGYPFPQIFLARGPIDIETMQAYQCVVDGQQRLNTILEYVTDKIEVDGGVFSGLTPKQKEEFLKYEVPVIDFDLDVGDPRLKEVFRRLNRTFYSLTAIEKIASEFSASEFLLVARVLCGEISNAHTENDTTDLPSSEDDSDTDETVGDIEGSDSAFNRFSRDPGIEESSWEWLLARADGSFATLIQGNSIFSAFEFDRKVPLMFTLNLMCTYLAGYFNRNDKVRKFLEDKNSEFKEKQEVIDALNNTADTISKLDLESNSIWWNKANFFTLVSEIALKRLATQDPVALKQALNQFSAKIPDRYALAAREAVGRKRERELRGELLRAAVAEYVMNPDLQFD